MRSSLKKNLVLGMSAALLFSACSGNDENNTSNQDTPDMTATQPDMPVTEADMPVTQPDMPVTQPDMPAETCNTNSTPSTQRPTSMCSDISASECVTSEDCGADERCEEFTEVGGIFGGCCVKGLRGCGSLEAACTNSLGCESGLCVDGLCSKSCEADTDCPASLPKCNAFAGVCIIGD